MLVDLSHSIWPDMPVFPGDHPVKLRQSGVYEEHGFSDFHFSAGMHAGTHIDGPMHLTNSQVHIGEIPPERFTGPGFLFRVTGQQLIDLPESTFQELPAGSVLLFHTGYDRLFGQDAYFASHPVLTEETARYMVKYQVKMIGMDTPSPDYAPFPIHRILLANGIMILENLTNLSTIRPTDPFEIMAFPLKIQADSSPVRVIANIKSP